MGDIIRRKLLLYDVLTVLSAVILVGFLTITSSCHIRYDGSEREVRVQINQLLARLQQELKENTEVTADLSAEKFPCCVFDCEGRVLQSTIKAYRKGTTVDLRTIGSRQHYMVPIVSQKTVKGMLLADTSVMQEQKLRTFFIQKIGVSAVLLLIICLLRLRAHRVIKRDIWNPIREIHQSTRSILNGNWDAHIQYDYSGEVGTLCHDFERMRDEIHDRELREQQASEKERVLYASISHDLKTPLAIITGYLEEILYGVTETPEQIQETAKRALTKAKLLNKLTEDILEHSKAQMNQLSIHKQEIYADTFFGQLLEEYREDSCQQNYQFSYNTPPRVLLSVDTDRIAQVVQNIVSNAVKYSENALQIEVSFEVFTQAGGKKILVVSIKDNGKGIDAADLPFVFDLFYRGNKARTQNVPGSGIGLNLSRYIIEQHGGSIECDSIVGMGTTVSFSLPFL